jgi:hypothetical protein
MEKILFVAYQFPPRGGPGVHRSLNFVKYLREFGYDPIVLTVEVDDIKRAGYTMDESLLQQVPEGVQVVRTASHEPVHTIRTLMKLHLFRPVWFFFFPWFKEWAVRWPSHAYPVAEALIREHNIRLVYTSSSPYSSLVLGRKLQKRLGIKWVADLRDPLTDGYGWPWPSKLHWLFDRFWERRILGCPQMLIVNTPEVKELYLQRKISEENRIKVLTNGY